MGARVIQELWIRFGAVAIAVGVCTGSDGTAFGQGQASGSTRDIHFDIVQRGNPMHLSNRNFIAIAAGTRYPVTVTKGTGPGSTHLLVILDQEPQNVWPYEAALSGVRTVLDRGWLVSLVRPDGYPTPYLDDENALRRALYSGGSMGSNCATLLSQLAGFAGRRLLIIEQSAKNTDPAVMAAARNATAEVYRVDGGKPERPDEMRIDGPVLGLPPGADPPGDFIEEAPPPPAYSQPPQPYEKWRSPNGVMHEIELRTAVADALKDAADYYDVDVKLPVAGSAGRVSLQARHIYKDAQLKIGSSYSIENKNGVPLRKPS